MLILPAGDSQVHFMRGERGEGEGRRVSERDADMMREGGGEGEGDDQGECNCNWM